MSRVIAIKEGNDIFVQSVIIVVGTNPSKLSGLEYFSYLQTNLCFFLKVRMKIILNNDIELKMKYLEGRSVLMEFFLNGHYKSE